MKQILQGIFHFEDTECDPSVYTDVVYKYWKHRRFMHEYLNEVFIYKVLGWETKIVLIQTQENGEERKQENNHKFIFIFRAQKLSGNRG